MPINPNKGRVPPVPLPDDPNSSLAYAPPNRPVVSSAPAIGSTSTYQPNYPVPNPVPPVPPQPGPTPTSPPPPNPQQTFREIVRNQMKQYRGKNRPADKGARKGLRKQAIDAAIAQLGGDSYKPSDRQQKIIDRVNKTGKGEAGNKRYDKRIERKKRRRGLIEKNTKGE